MADHQINTALYEQALVDITEDYFRKHPDSRRAAADMSLRIEQHAKNLFAVAWDGAWSIEENRRTVRDSSSKPQLNRMLADKLEKLGPEDRASLEKLQSRLNDRLKSDLERLDKVFDDNHHKMLLLSFTGSGVSQATAEQIVDTEILSK